MEIKSAAILIISDEAFKDPTLDHAASALAPILVKEEKWELSAIRIVPNNVLQIQQAVCDWTSGPNWHHLVLLSAVAGLGGKDHTAEAVTLLINRHAPIPIQSMITESLKFTPFTKLERSIVGVREKTLIVSLPRSSKGAMENIEAVMKLLPHVFPQYRRSLHTTGLNKSNTEAAVTISQHPTQPQLEPYHQHHAHGHLIRKAHTSPHCPRSKSNTPAMGLNQRYHPCFNPTLSVEEALRVICEQTPAPIVVETPVTTSIIGSVIAEDVYASEMLPAYPTSLVDGYAIVAIEGKSTNAIFHRSSITHANMSGAFEPLRPGIIAKITAGASLPPNANAVVRFDDTASSALDGQEEATVEILADDIFPGENVREPGSDITLNSKILDRGDLISPVGGEIGLLAATGTRAIKVFKKCRVGVLSIGAEA